MEPIDYTFKTDHDVVIALIEDFNNSIREFNKQAAANSTDLDEIKRALINQNETTNKRLNDIEEQLRSLDPKQLAKDVRENNEFRKNFNQTKHVAWIVASAIFLIIGYLLNFFLQHIKLSLFG